ncbi:MAG TPA: Holliday junction resolvase RuvX [Candidatus Bathyarchaeia archaeon]|nr:Holliday junction resolvase RuvX [Candidatus Bathyarchaeia archaeon]
MIYLGIDYGKAKVGLALAEGILAQPLQILPNKVNLIGRVVQLCQKYCVNKIVIGLPEGKLEKEVGSFGRQLANKSGLPVEFYPECLTTQEAIVKMIEAGKSKKFRRTREDKIAAAIILQNYLDCNV